MDLSGEDLEVVLEVLLPLLGLQHSPGAHESRDGRHHERAWGAGPPGRTLLVKDSLALSGIFLVHLILKLCLQAGQRVSQGAAPFAERPPARGPPPGDPAAIELRARPHAGGARHRGAVPRKVQGRPAQDGERQDRLWGGGCPPVLNAGRTMLADAAEPAARSPCSCSRCSTRGSWWRSLLRMQQPRAAAPRCRRWRCSCTKQPPRTNQNLETPAAPMQRGPRRSSSTASRCAPASKRSGARPICSCAGTAGHPPTSQLLRAHAGPGVPGVVAAGVVHVCALLPEPGSPARPREATGAAGCCRGPGWQRPWQRPAGGGGSAGRRQAHLGPAPALCTCAPWLACSPPPARACCCACTRTWTPARPTWRSSSTPPRCGAP